MNRWIARAAGLAFAVAATAAAHAQGIVREAPAGVRPGIIAVTPTPPLITVNGQPDRLSPGARIRDVNNLLVLSGQLAGREMYAVYKRDGAGLVHEVWLLTADEYRKVGGLDVADPRGLATFTELLAAIWLARQGAPK